MYALHSAGNHDSADAGFQIIVIIASAECGTQRTGKPKCCTGSLKSADNRCIVRHTICAKDLFGFYFKRCTEAFRSIRKGTVDDLDPLQRLFMRKASDLTDADTLLRNNVFGRTAGDRSDIAYEKAYSSGI